MAESNATTSCNECLVDDVQKIAVVLDGFGELMNENSGTLTDATTMALAIVFRELSNKLFDVSWKLDALGKKLHVQI